MMKRFLTLALPLTALLMVAPLAASAEDTKTPTTSGVPSVGQPVAGSTAPELPPSGPMKEKFDSLPPEKQAMLKAKWAEHRKHREAIREQIAKLPPEKQTQIKAKMAEWHKEHAELREKLKTMTPEERHKFMEERRAAHDEELKQFGINPPK